MADQPRPRAVRYCARSALLCPRWSRCGRRWSEEATMTRGQSDEPSPAPAVDTRAGAYDAVGVREQQRLETQSDLYGELAAWTLDALGLQPGWRVLELGCGTGSLLTSAARLVGPTGRVVGIDRNPRLLAAARARAAAHPWIEVVEADATTYDAPGAELFDAVHCR